MWQNVTVGLVMWFVFGTFIGGWIFLGDKTFKRLNGLGKSLSISVFLPYWIVIGFGKIFLTSSPSFKKIFFKKGVI